MIKEWIRDWLPSVSIIIGGLWVFFRWVYSEFVNNIPSISGALELETVWIEPNILLEVRGRWRNQSSRGISIDTDSPIQVFVMDGAVQPGLVNLEKKQPAYEFYPFKSLDKMILEPKTESLVRAYCIIPPGKVYIVRWKLLQRKRLGSGFEWSKEAVLDLRENFA